MSTWRISPITRGSSRRPVETSRLAPIRDSESPFKQWQKLRASMTQQQHQVNHTAAMRAAAGRDMWSWSPDLMHPFKIYRYPLEITRQFVPIADINKVWRTFRVRAGYVFTTSAEGVPVGATDLIFDFPYQQSLFTLANGTRVDQSLVQNIIVPENTHYFYIWVELSSDGTAAGLRWHTDPTQNEYIDLESASGDGYWTSANPWTGWPTPDAFHFLIGWVDTLSQARIHRALPRQVQTTDILASGGGSNCPYG